MDYVFYAVGIIFILYQLFGKKYFAQKRLDAIVEHIAEPSTKYVSDDAGETSLAMYFYYACLILTCQKRDTYKSFNLYNYYGRNIPKSTKARF